MDRGLILSSNYFFPHNPYILFGAWLRFNKAFIITMIRYFKTDSTVPPGVVINWGFVKGFDVKFMFFYSQLLDIRNIYSILLNVENVESVQRQCSSGH